MQAPVIKDVCVDFPNLLGHAGKVKKVVLNLEVLTKRDEDGFGESVGLDGLGLRGVGLEDMGYVHSEGNREVEGLVCSFVNHNK